MKGEGRMTVKQMGFISSNENKAPEHVESVQTRCSKDKQKKSKWEATYMHHASHDEYNEHLFLWGLVPVSTQGESRWVR